MNNDDDIDQLPHSLSLRIFNPFFNTLSKTIFFFFLIYPHVHHPLPVLLLLKTFFKLSPKLYVYHPHHIIILLYHHIDSFPLFFLQLILIDIYK